VAASGLYTADSIERVKEAVDMVELVGSRTDLRRVGARHTGLCPFHDERTPSFSVNAENRLYHCFGCGASGDAIRFVETAEGLDFKESVELLADRYGVELRREREDPEAEERRRRRDRLMQLVDRTATYYERYLWQSPAGDGARSYLRERGLGEQVLRDFRVGLSPSHWDRVVLGAQRDGFTQDQIAAAGLGQRSRQGSFFDRFRGRIMFPLADARGRVLGFGARALEEGQQPKYLNTSENELYHKGRQLFGIDRARGPTARAGRVVVVEGYTDVLALHQAGVTETVAIMGTALTQEQLVELSRAASVVYLALDADRSGREAMLRAARVAEERGMELRVVAVPEGVDPAELVVAEGAEAFTALLDSAQSVPEFQVGRVLAEADLATAHGRDRALVAVRPIVAATAERSATRDELVRRVADRLDVPAGYVTSGVAAAAGPGSARAATARAAPMASLRDGFFSAEGGTSPLDVGSSRTGERGSAPGMPSPVTPASRAERAFLATCLAQGERGAEYLRRLSDDHLSSDHVRSARDHLLAHPHDVLQNLPSHDTELSALITDIAMLAEAEPSSEPALRLGFLQLELRRMERELRRARHEEDVAWQTRLYTEREEVRRRMDGVMGETA